MAAAPWVDELTRLGLIDEYRLMLYPIIVGTGKRLLNQPQSTTHLGLADSRSTSTGVLVLTYTRADAAAPTT